MQAVADTEISSLPPKAIAATCNRIHVFCLDAWRQRCETWMLLCISRPLMVEFCNLASHCFLYWFRQLSKSWWQCASVCRYLSLTLGFLLLTFLARVVYLFDRVKLVCFLPYWNGITSPLIWRGVKCEWCWDWHARVVWRLWVVGLLVASCLLLAHCLLVRCGRRSRKQNFMPVTGRCVLSVAFRPCSIDPLLLVLAKLTGAGQLVLANRSTNAMPGNLLKHWKVLIVVSIVYVPSHVGFTWDELTRILFDVAFKK